MGSSRNPFHVQPPSTGNPPPSFHPVAGDDETTLNPLTDPVPDLPSILGAADLPPIPAEERDRKQPFPSPVITLEPPPPPAYTATPDIRRDEPTFDVGPSRPFEQPQSTRFTASSHGLAQGPGVTSSYTRPAPGVTSSYTRPAQGVTPSYTGPAPGITPSYTGPTNTSSNFLTSSLTSFPFARRGRRPGLIHQIAGSLLSSDDHHGQNRSYDVDDSKRPPELLSSPWPIPGRRNSFDASQIATSSLAPQLQSQPSTSSPSSPALESKSRSNSVRSHRYSPSESPYMLNRPPVGPGVVVSGAGSPAPAGAPVYAPGDRRGDGVRCWMCGGTGTVSRFIFDRSQCGTCKGLGKWYM